MTDIKDDAARDEVLFAFQLANPRPAPADITAWIRRHPAFEADIIEHAALLIEAARDGEEDTSADDTLVARGHSHMLNALFKADRRLETSADRQATSLEGLFKASGKRLPDLAREIDIGRGVLTDLVSGRMAPPMGRRLVEALTRALGVSVANIVAAFEATLSAPLMGRAKATVQPVARRRPYAEIVMADPNMSDERKAFWLEG